MSRTESRSFEATRKIKIAPYISHSLHSAPLLTYIDYVKLKLSKFCSFLFPPKLGNGVY